MSTVNVKDHGVAGDGVTDDAPAIQNVFDNVSGDGDTIFFPSGYYLLESGLTLPPKRAVIGESEATTCLKLAASVAGSVKLLHMNDAEGMLIEHLAFDPQGTNKAYDAEGEAIHATYIKRSTIRSVIVRNAVSEAIDFDHPTDVLVEDFRAEDCGGNAVHAGAVNDAVRMTVRKAYAKNCSHRREAAGAANPYAFKISGDYNTIEDVFADNCANGVGTIAGKGSVIINSTAIGGAIGFHGGGASVLNCLADGCTSRGVSAAEAAIGNTIIGNGITNVGISLTSDNAVAASNRVFDIEFTAISVSSPNAITGIISGNIIEGSGQYAVHIIDAAYGWSVLGNAYSGQSVYLPPGTIVANNRS